MKLFAALFVAEAPLAALAWLAVHAHDTGVRDGVLWLVGLGAVVLGLLVAAAFTEQRL